MIKVTIKDGDKILHESTWCEIKLTETNNLKYSNSEDNETEPEKGTRKLTISGK